MKKIIILFGIIAIFLSGIGYLYLVGKSNDNAINKHNITYKNCYQREIYGSEVATIINKAIDSNEKNDIPKTRR